jgi:hypothetical protein
MPYASSPVLPPEIWAVAVAARVNADAVTLLSPSLVCRAWRPFAQEALFACVKITSPLTLARFMAALASALHLGAAVRTLVLKGCSPAFFMSPKFMQDRGWFMWTVREPDTRAPGVRHASLSAPTCVKGVSLASVSKNATRVEWGRARFSSDVEFLISIQGRSLPTHLSLQAFDISTLEHHEYESDRPQM